MNGDVHERMRADWNARAEEDARYYVAFGARGQSQEEFFATASQVVRSLETEARRFSREQLSQLRILEIGCGPGRLMLPLSRIFGEVHGVDVSDAMIRRAEENLRGVSNAFPRVTQDAALEFYEGESFDLVFSYAVFQHIPSRQVVLDYLKAARRVLKPGGILRAQFNGLRETGSAYDTWSGVRIPSSDLMDFAQENDFQVLANEGASTQYLWVTWRKRPRGWRAELLDRRPEVDVHVRRLTNTHTSEPVAPSRGRFASISLWVEGLPAECGLHDLQVRVGGALGSVTYIGPPDNTGVQQVNVILPPLESTGLLPVEIFWLDRAIAPPVTLRVIPPGPVVPRLVSVSDGINLCSGTRIETGSVKAILEEIARPEEIAASVDGKPVLDLESFCTDPGPQKFEVNFKLPEEITAGEHDLVLQLGRRKLAPVRIEVVPARVDRDLASDS